MAAGANVSEPMALLTTWTWAMATWSACRALIVAEPESLVVTMPTSETCATAGSDDVHWTVAFTTDAPAALTDNAVSLTESPSITRIALGDIVSNGAGVRTTTVAVSGLPPALAVMRAAPGDNAVTRPKDETLATPGSIERQLTSWERVALLASKTRADSWRVAVGRSVSTLGEIETDRISCGGASVEAMESAPEQAVPASAFTASNDAATTRYDRRMDPSSRVRSAAQPA